MSRPWPMHAPSPMHIHKINKNNVTKLLSVRCTRVKCVFPLSVCERCIRTSVWVHVEVRGQSQLSFSGSCPPWFRRRVLSLAWCTAVRLGCQASEFQGSICLCFPSTETTGMHHCASIPHRKSKVNSDPPISCR